MAIAYLGLGSNLGDPAHYLQRAVDRLAVCPDIRIERVSRAYRTKPLGGLPNQADYLNAVVKVDCTLEPRELLGVCSSIEHELGRVRTERWGSRTIDIDLLLYDLRVVDEPDLIVPHPRLRDRLFVLVPLSDVAPRGMALPPDGVKLDDILDADMGISKFAEQLPIIPTGSVLQF